MSVKEYWREIDSLSKEVSTLFNSFWHEYSNWSHWQFWVLLFFILFPLIVLLIKLDKENTFEMLFYAFTVHMLWTYTELSLIRLGYMDHYYFIFPFLPQALGITASFLPISFMFVYQYCKYSKKKFVVWTLLLSAIMSFVFAPIEQSIGLLNISNGLTYIYIFVIDFVIAVSAYCLTKFFCKFYKSPKPNTF
ncbi:hypothetical protein [Bacillus sp. B1-b2]|uniref:hypothetical protein n=1 Tax=Bacillus sp. B1-b2 TaxID=2653201 RepID=UPI0012624C09|nr:hypothetical protein [Bacillus sp. B1-b2]KAB7664306.1 hypothetical protein F9279_23005 [Bacillus sp. B1-b2]